MPWITRLDADGEYISFPSITLSGDFEIIFDNFEFNDVSPSFLPMCGISAASTDFLIYRGYWQFRANGNSSDFPNGELEPFAGRLGRVAFSRSGSQGTIEYNGESLTQTVPTDDFTIDAFNVANVTLFSRGNYGNVTIKQGGSAVYFWDFDNSNHSATTITETVAGNNGTIQAAGVAAWEEMPTVVYGDQLSFIQLPNGAQGQNPSGGWTCTGLDKLSNGNWLCGNHGQSTSGSTQTPSIVELSADKTTIVNEIDMTPIIGAVTLQGVTYADDGTYWIASQGDGVLVNVTSAGALINSYAIADVNGVAFDSSRGTSGSIWYCTQSTGFAIRRFDIALEATQSADDIPYTFTTPDQLHYQANKIYLSEGPNGQNGSVWRFDVATKQIDLAIPALQDIQAIEGIYLEGDSLTVLHDGGFHTDASQPTSRIAEFDVQIPLLPVTASVNLSLDALGFAATSTVTLPVPVSAASLQLDGLSFAVTSNVTLPVPVSAATLQLDELGFTAFAGGTLPTPVSSATLQLESLGFDAAANATQSTPVASVGFSIGELGFDAESAVTLPDVSSSVTMSLGELRFTAVVGEVVASKKYTFSLTPRKLSGALTTRKI